jgi:ER-bound oxygenase mpaB/B'/Rubber oxygenase, catalytic domain
VATARVILVSMDDAPAALIPSRFRNPLHDPDPVTAQRYRELFGHDVTPSAPDITRLAQALGQSDCLADAWVERAHSLGRPRAESLFARALRHGVDTLGTDAPSELVTLCRSTEAVPAWVDPQLLRLGGRTFRRAGLVGSFVLADFALLGGYRSSAVAKTLVRTGRLRDAAAERLIYTGRFVTGVTEPGALLPFGAGYGAALRVRVMHAEVRRALMRTPSWDSAAWGLPINQADMLGTNLLFSIGYVTGCRSWGLSFSPREVEAVLHLWRYVGVLLGVDQALMPVDEASAEAALYLVGVSQPEPDADSVALARALYEVPLSFERPPWARRLIAFEMALRVGMARELLGDVAVDQLGLPRSRLRVLLPAVRAAIRAVEGLRTRLPGGTYAAYRAGDFLVKRGEQALTRELANARRVAPAGITTAHPSAA